MNYAIQQLYARRRREQTAGAKALYHGTPKKNLKSILLKGMIAQAGENSRAAGDLDRTVSLTPDKKLARDYAGKGGALLAVDPEHSSLEAHRFEPDPHEKKSVRTLRGIPPQAIRVAEASAHTATRNWRGLDVDTEMQDRHLDKLNSNPHGRVVSSCAGHPELKGTHSDMGGDDHPGFNLVLHHPDPAYAEALSDHLDDHDTVPETIYWGGSNGNVVTHFNGEPRDLRGHGFDASHQKYMDDAQKNPPKQIALRVQSLVRNTGHNAPELHAWWDRTLDQLHSFKHVPKPSKARSVRPVETTPKAGRVDSRRRFIEAQGRRTYLWIDHPDRVIVGDHDDVRDHADLYYARLKTMKGFNDHLDHYARGSAEVDHDRKSIVAYCYNPRAEDDRFSGERHDLPARIWNHFRKSRPDYSIEERPSYRIKEATRSEITPARLAQQFGYRNVFNTDSHKYGEVTRYLHPNGHNLIVTRRLKLGRDRVQNAEDPGAWDMQWSHTTSGNEVNAGHTIRGLFDRLSRFHRTR